MSALTLPHPKVLPVLYLVGFRTLSIDWIPMNPTEEEKQSLLSVNNNESIEVPSANLPSISGKNQQQQPSQPPQSGGEDEAKDDKGSILVIAFVLMLIFQLGNRIFGRLQTYPMHNYPLFLNIVMVAVYIPVCYMYIIPAMIWTNNITKEQTEIPKYKFAVMGAYDSLAGIMQTFAINYISNASMIVLVQQSAIPISMVISSYALKSVYTKEQYMGAGIVLLGIIVVLIPSFLDTSSSTSSSTSTTISPSSYELLWILILVISCVPMCLSSVYKEKALGETEIDIVYLNGWVSIFQFLIAIPLCWPSSAVQNIPLGEIMPNLYDGMKCWMGINSVTEDHNPLGLPLDDCSTAPLFVTTYLFFNVVYNFLIIVILKHGSANIMWMASTVIVPLSNVAFSLKFMPGSQPLRTWDIVGLFVIMGGLVVYRFSGALLSLWAMLTGQKESKEEEELHKRKRNIVKSAEKKQLKYLGINQTEYLQSFVDTRVEREMYVLFRSPQQIRGAYLAKVGVQPSPLISMGPGRRPMVDKDALSAAKASYQTLGKSPMLSSLNRSGSLRNNNAQLGNNRGYSILNNSPAIGGKNRVGRTAHTLSNEV
eukprot:scaffold1447_cov165-Ochromonas_danica.AAC.10